MPKDEIDPEDPMELRGVALLTEEDTSDSMTECFVEEFLRLGFGPAQVLALFRNPHYTGPNMVLVRRGEDWVRGKIAEVFGWWGRPVTLRDRPAGPAQPPPVPGDGVGADAGPPPVQAIEFESGPSDPGGGAVPRIQL